MSAATVVDRLRETARDAGVRVRLHAVRLDGDGGRGRVDLDGDEPVAVASLYKLPLALAWADLVAAGDLGLRDPLPLPRAGRTPGPTGVGMLLDDVVLTARDGVRLMLAVSDNACGDALLDLVGRDRLNAHLAAAGVPRTVVRRGTGASRRRIKRELGSGVDDVDRVLADPDRDVATREYDAAYASASTAREACRVLEVLWSRRHPAHACVRDALALQAWRHRIGSGFPHDDVVVHGKTGTLGRLRHEAAVVCFPHEHPVAVTVLTEAVRPERHLPHVDAAIGELARTAVTVLRRPADDPP